MSQHAENCDLTGNGIMVLKISFPVEPGASYKTITRPPRPSLVINVRIFGDNDYMLKYS